MSSTPAPRENPKRRAVEAKREAQLQLIKQQQQGIQHMLQHSGFQRCEIDPNGDCFYAAVLVALGMVDPEDAKTPMTKKALERVLVARSVSVDVLTKSKHVDGYGIFDNDELAELLLDIDDRRGEGGRPLRVERR